MSNINLLPWRTKRIFYKNNIFIAVCSIITIIILLFTLSINIFIKTLCYSKEKEISKLKEKIDFYQAKTKEIIGLKERKKLLLSRLSIVNNLQSQRTLIVNILEQIALNIPNGIALKHMELKENLILINAYSESNSRIAEFMRNLEKTKVFYSPKLKEIKSAPNNQNNNLNNIDFDLEINVASYNNEKN